MNQSNLEVNTHSQCQVGKKHARACNNWFSFTVNRIKKWYTFFNAIVWQLIIIHRLLVNTQTQVKTALYSLFQS